ncbi:MAG: response regulator transcription factor [Anaerolineae bacterium]|nr:response regulator transcription factor [Anaerolineae bacterium]
MTDKIRILVVDDHQMLRHGLAGLLSSFEDLEMIGECKSGQEAIRLASTLQPDVILMDLMMPDMSGVEATRRILEINPRTRIIALTSSDEKAVVSAALQAGMTGYLLKNVSDTFLAQAIRSVYHGKRTLSPEITEALIESALDTSPVVHPLSEREREVLRLMVRGQNNNEIAEILAISHSTVKFHVSGILSKMGVKNRVEAVKLAIEKGW